MALRSVGWIEVRSQIVEEMLPQQRVGKMCGLSRF